MLERQVRRVAGLVAVGAMVACGPSADTAGERLAPLLDGMGAHHHEITTSSPEAQRYFDQGLVLHYGFNHAEALRSFQEAQRLDPECAMCAWGEALTRGPNVNAGMPDDQVAPTWAALQRAIELAAGTSPPEKALIEALASRYGPEPAADRTELDAAYAEAMRQVVNNDPDDADAATLWAEALMATSPWDYWDEKGEPKTGFGDVLGILERALEVDPANPGANHFYIHAVEAVRPELGLESARQLERLVPGAGHLVHMPAHIYLRLGRYRDATLTNERAMEADASYERQSSEQGIYPTLYMPHNPHFASYTAGMEGRSAYVLDLARSMAQRIERQGGPVGTVGTVQHYWLTPWYAMARFGRWEEIMQLPEPAEALVYPRAIWHYARGLAQARLGDPEGAGAELAALQELTADPRVAEATVWDLNAADVLVAIADHTLAGEIELERGDTAAAITHLTAAVKLQDDLTYDEPPPWYYPVRQSLGVAYLAASRPADAEAAYREDLEQFPDNGWSLFGLAQALRAQGKNDEAAEVTARFDSAWANADVELTASRF